MAKHIICSPIPCDGCGKSIYIGLIFEIKPGEDGIYLCSSCYYSAIPLQTEKLSGLNQFEKKEV